MFLNALSKLVIFWKRILGAHTGQIPPTHTTAIKSSTKQKVHVSAGWWPMLTESCRTRENEFPGAK